jgi:hypothetical protein
LKYIRVVTESTTFNSDGCSKGRKLFEEINIPTGMKIISENSESIETESGWVGKLKGFNGFADGKKAG